MDGRMEGENQNLSGRIAGYAAPAVRVPLTSEFRLPVTVSLSSRRKPI
jgi:hypothetical protein